MKISVYFLRDRTSTFEDNSCVVLVAVLAMVGLLPITAIIKNVLALREGHTTSSESAPKPYALLLVM